MPRRWLPYLAAAVLTAGVAAEPTREQETEARLAELKAQIADIQKGIERKRGERSSLQQRLADAERAIGQLDKRLKTIEQAIADELPKLQALDREREQLREQVAQQEADMGAELRNLWSLRQGGGARIVFGDQDPDQIARNLAYYQRLLEHRRDAIEAFGSLLESVAINADKIRASQVRLAEQREALETERKRAAELQDERRAALAQLESSLSKDSDRVAQLEADSRQLSELLEQLRATLAELDTPVSYKPFTKARGEMTFPVSGNPNNRFGGRRNSANMRWRGWLIPAREGSDVKAIHHGRVVYADWLRGQGLLLIVDHGEGYLSLYGQNRSLQRDVGDWVRPGDVIATVGASGGADSPALYFEIRHEGDPVDPGKWLRR